MAKISPERVLPKNTVISTKGATADIIMQEWPDHKNALKKSKKPENNALLQNEYTVLLILGSGNNCPHSIPQVYDDFPVNESSDVYAFQEELLSGYKSLFDRDAPEHAREALDGLSEFDRVVVLDELRKGFQYANDEGFIYGDVQLDNTMVRGIGSKLQVKIPDWGLVQKVDSINHLRDVKQLAEVIPQLFDGVDLPVGIENWMRKVQSGRYGSFKNAWDQLNLAVNDYMIES